MARFYSSLFHHDICYCNSQSQCECFLVLHSALHVVLVPALTPKWLKLWIQTAIFFHTSAASINLTIVLLQYPKSWTVTKSIILHRCFDQDVLFGRGYQVAAHPGNQTLRAMVRSYKPQFLQQRRDQKRDVARKIVNDVIHKIGGRFLIEEDPKGGVRVGIYQKPWVCADYDKAVDKGLFSIPFDFAVSLASIH